MQTPILGADCVTTPLSEHLPGPLRTFIPYAIGPYRRQLALVRRIKSSIRRARGPSQAP